MTIMPMTLRFGRTSMRSVLLPFSISKPMNEFDIFLICDVRDQKAYESAVLVLRYRSFKDGK